VRWLLLLAAAGWLARMALHPRIYHYGYCQASLAAMVAVATAWRTLPDIARLAGRVRVLHLGVLGVVLLVAVAKLETRSLERFALETQPVGAGADRFYGFSALVDPAAYVVEETRRALAPDRGGSLLVLPEGLMLNYLLRAPSPTALHTFGVLTEAQRARVLEDLAAHPPERVVILSRSLREYGVDRFGESPAHGADLLAWVRAHYDLQRRIGGDPLDPAQRGAEVWRRKP
jgi:hypothetical protein